MGLYREADGLGGARHDLDRPAVLPLHPLSELAPIGAVGPELAYASRVRFCPLHHIVAALAIRLVRGMHEPGGQQAKRVDQDGAFTAFDVLAAVIAAGSPLSVVFTLWLSMISAVGSGARPWRTRSFCRRA